MVSSAGSFSPITNRHSSLRRMSHGFLAVLADPVNSQSTPRPEVESPIKATPGFRNNALGVFTSRPQCNFHWFLVSLVSLE